MRIEKDRKKAYIGVGFQERSEALDFKIALQEYKKYLDEPEYEDDDEEQDYALQEGETLHVEVAIKNKKVKVKLIHDIQRHNKKKVDDVIEVDENGSLAPPPEAGSRMSIMSVLCVGRRRGRGRRKGAEEAEEEAAPAQTEYAAPAYGYGAPAYAAAPAPAQTDFE